MLKRFSRDYTPREKPRASRLTALTVWVLTLSQSCWFGNRAGRSAATYASSASAPASAKIQALAADEQKRLDREFLKKDGGKEKIATIRQEMQKTMEEGAGIYRDEQSMEKTCNA